MRCEDTFARLGWRVLRQPAVDARRLKSTHGFQSQAKYAHSLSTRMMVRRAAAQKAETLFIFEDDVVFHPDLEARLAAIELPDDWGIFYLGCQHHERPVPISRGLVRATAPLDTHAWGIRASYYQEVRRVLAGRCWPKGDHIPASDVLLAELVRRIPAYAAYPNLAWQHEDQSDIVGTVWGNYEPGGSQRHARHCLTGVHLESLGGTPHPPAVAAAGKCEGFFWAPELRRSPAAISVKESPLKPLTPDGKVAFLFLTRGRHHHPDVWQNYWRGETSRISVYGHASDRSWAAADSTEDWLATAQIPSHCPTVWGDISLVHAELALLKTALADLRNQFFVFASESCIPVRPLQELLRLLSIDGRSRFRTETIAQVHAVNPFKSARASECGPVPPEDWRFHPQWMLLNREAAELIMSNAPLVDLFAGTHAPDESAFGTLLHLAGYPMESRVASQDITWTRWPSSIAANPETFFDITPEVAGDIAASGCYFARKFGPGSYIGNYGLHLPAGR